LNYEQNVISFEFASTDFSAFDINRFKYQMAGFDKDWINSRNTHNATYTNLDPGTILLGLREATTMAPGMKKELPFS
jgi:hypothetical protein